MIKHFRYPFFILLLVFLQSTVWSQDKKYHDVIPDVPKEASLVQDLGSMLTDEEERKLAEKLFNFEQETSNEIAVVTVDTLGGLEVSEFANELGRKWDIGKEKKKNGILLLISKKDRKLNISPGYGLQGALPDVICSRIIREYLVPNFRAGDVYRGIDEGTNAIIAATKGEFTNDTPSSKGSGIFPLIIIIFFIILFIVISYKRRNTTYVSRRGYKNYDSGSNWFPGGGFGGFGGGGGDDSGGGFGGFGGGGGGFDGGGSSGSW